jgi:hypothetical protein
MRKMGKLLAAASVCVMAMGAQAGTVTCDAGSLEVQPGALDGTICEQATGDVVGSVSDNGTWELLGNDIWGSYAEVFITISFGGNWFTAELDPNAEATAGTWEFTGAAGATNLEITLGSVVGTPRSGELPLPGSVPLVGLALGLLGLASVQRRNQHKR